jgi:O-antigen biosynthesis protein
MRILTSSYTLDRAGVPTFTLTMVNELKRLGHDVCVYSPKGGALADKMATVSDPARYEQPDLIIAQHSKCAYGLAKAHPTTPFLYYVHGVLPDLEQPPRNIRVDRWLVINTQTRDHIIRQYVPPTKIDIVRDFIDTEEFRPPSVVMVEPEAKPRVIFISNYKKWKQYYRLTEACRRLGWPLTCVGAPYGRSRNIVRDIQEHDIVVSWGRGILEGMACGKPVISYDCELGDGMLDTARYFESRERNFSGYECRYMFTVDDLVAELCRYDPSDGVRNRELVLLHHDVRVGVQKILHVASLCR